jgi:hypothetical protein
MARAVDEPARGDGDFAPEPPTKYLPPMPYAEMPPSQPLRKVLGPSVILAGLGVGSGEYILWPYITTQVGLGFLWAALLGVTVQLFLNMEIERYTLATGETAITGFSRFWKPWGAIMMVCAFVINVWPGWATSGSTALSFLFGLSEDSVPYITLIAIVAIGITLTVSPVVYKAMETAEFIKVGLVAVFLVVAIVSAISASAWAEVPTIITEPVGPGDLPVALVLGSLAFAGAGGITNLVQSNWMRDKGFGMGEYVPRIVSPFTGEEEAKPSTGNMIRQDEQSLARWKEWWRVANIEQFVSFWLICFLSIALFSVLAFSTVGVSEIAEEPNLDFIKAEGEQLAEVVGPWFQALFWFIGAASLLLVALGVADYVSRVFADVLKTLYMRESDLSESKIYAIVVWTFLALGAVIVFTISDQPLILLVVSASLSGIVMFVYSILLIQLNRKALPEAIKVRGFRLGTLYFSVLFFGFFSGWYLLDQLGILG